MKKRAVKKKNVQKQNQKAEVPRLPLNEPEEDVEIDDLALEDEGVPELGVEIPIDPDADE